MSGFARPEGGIGCLLLLLLLLLLNRFDRVEVLWKYFSLVDEKHKKNDSNCSCSSEVAVAVHNINDKIFTVCWIQKFEK